MKYNGVYLSYYDPQSEYLPATRSEEAVTSLPGGEEYYRACLKFHTSTNLTPQEIHTLGMTEVARIEEEVQKVQWLHLLEENT